MVSNLSLFPLTSLFFFVAAAAAAKNWTVNILFVGSSFTYGYADPVLHYGNSTISDVRGTGYGGVPAIFRRMIEDHPDVQVGYNVTMLAHDGPGIDLLWLASHYPEVLQRSGWAEMVVQEAYGVLVPAGRGGDPSRAAEGMRSIREFSWANSSPVTWLWETWPTPNLVYPSNMQYYNCGSPDIGSYLIDLIVNTAMLGIPYGITNQLVVRVGSMFMKVASSGFADINPYDNKTARINLWAGDNINASKYGSYLAALTLARRLGGFPVMDLPRAAGSVAAELGIDEDIAAKLAQFVDNTEVPP